MFRAGNVSRNVLSIRGFVRCFEYSGLPERSGASECDVDCVSKTLELVASERGVVLFSQRGSGSEYVSPSFLTAYSSGYGLLHSFRTWERL